MKELIRITIILSIAISTFSVVAFGQAERSDDPAIIRAQEVLDQARKVVGLKEDISKLKAFSIQIEQVSETSTTDQTVTTGGAMDEKVKIDAELPDKIKINKSRRIGMASASESETVNRDAYEFQLDSHMNGGLFVSRYINTNRPEDAQMGPLRIKLLQWDLFLRIFPITLDASWFNGLEFKFIGIAEAPDGKADVLQAVSSNNVIYRCFFDKETHFLLMLTKTSKNKENKKAKDTYFFSDYKRASNLLYPHKMIRQSTKDSFTFEFTINELAININPYFERNLFYIKEK